MSNTWETGDDSEGFLPFGMIARTLIGMQCQYASEYIHGRGRKPALGDGLRFRNWPNTGGSYHDIEIHKDDVKEFVKRVTDHRREIGAIR